MGLHRAAYLFIPLLLLAACRDDGGGIEANNTDPTIDFVSPQADAAFLETDEIIVRGTVSDREDPPSRLTVSLILGNGDPIAITPEATGDWRYALETLEPGDFVLEARVRDSQSGLGTDEVSFSVSAVNKAPTANIIAPEGGASFDEGVGIMLEGEVGDDAPVANLTVQWSSSIDGVIADSAPDLGGYVSVRTDELSPGNHQLRLIALDDEGLKGQDEISITIIDINEAPEDPSLELTPSRPVTGDDLTLTILNEGADPDGDEVSYAIRWYRDDDLVADLNDRRTVPADRTARGQVWRVDVTASDPLGVKSTVSSASVTVLNSAPALASATLSPQNAYQYSVISVILTGGADADGDLISYRYGWTINGAEIQDYSGSTINGDYFSRGDEVRALVTPTDGSSDGQTLLTDPVVIQDAPALGLEVEILPQAPVLTDGLSCEIITPAQDIDGETVSYRYTWSRDGEVVYDDEVGRDTIDARETGTGEIWNCTVTPYSGGLAGETASDQVVIRAGTGTIVVTEIMARPNVGGSGEYVELHNLSSVGVDLSGWVLRDDGTDRYVISPQAALTLPAGAYLVIGASTDTEVNGGVDVDLAWSGFSLADGGDEVVVEADGDVVDRVRYGSAAGILPSLGAALNLDVSAYDEGANDAPESWCRATSPLDEGGFGTPGTLNDLCACAASDADGDGWGSDAASCAVTDCDDLAPTTYPGAPEICEDGADNDCTGGDELCDCASSDGDGDGYGDVLGCPAGERDCDDNNPDTYPGAPELCDDKDNDCDNSVDDGLDTDGDGARVCPVEGNDEDCDDLDADVYPGNTEVCDGKDNNCNSSTDEGYDVDGDGFTICAGDCDDADGSVNPGESEICEDGKDNNCSGQDALCACAATDLDGDGFGGGDGCPVELRDCDDANPSTYPQATELCDDFDNDCDGVADEGLDADEDGFESCDATSPDCDDADAEVYPGADEECDLIDEDCDGATDEGYDLDQDGYVTCGPTILADCDDEDPAINPGADEECDDEDNDCDNITDEGFDDPYEPNDRKDSAYNGGFLVAARVLNLTIDEPGDVDWFSFTTSEVGLSGSYLRVDTKDIAIKAELCNKRLPDLCIDVSAGTYDVDTEFFPSVPFPQGGEWFLEVRATSPLAVSCETFAVTVFLK